MVMSTVAHAAASYDDCMNIGEIGITAMMWKDEGVPYEETLSRFLDDQTGQWAPSPALVREARFIIDMVYTAKELQNASVRDLEMMAFGYCNL